MSERVRIEQLLWMNGIGFGLFAASGLAQWLGLILFVFTFACMWFVVSKSARASRETEQERETE